MLNCDKYLFVDMFPFTDECLKSVDMVLMNRQNVDMFLAAFFEQTVLSKHVSIDQRVVCIIGFISSCHMETVASLTKAK